MQITDMLNQYNRNIANGVEISGGTQGIKQIADSLQEMAVGNVFEGNVNHLENGIVTLGLSDGKTIQAKLDSGVSVKVGESMFFQVKSNNGEQIALRPYSNGITQNPTLLKALEAANLQVNAKTLTMVNTMMEQSMSIDKQSLIGMAKLVMGNDGIDITSIVQMEKLGISVNDEMAAQFENYKSDQYAIRNRLESVMELLPEKLADGKLSQNQLLELNEKIAEVFLGEGKTVEEEAGEESTFLTENIQTTVDAENSEQLQKEILKEVHYEAEDIVAKEENPGINDITKEENSGINDITKEEVVNETREIMQNKEPSETGNISQKELTDEAEQFSQNEKIRWNRTDNPLKSQADTLKHIFNGSELNKLFRQLAKIPELSQNTLLFRNGIGNAEITSKELLQLLKEAFLTENPQNRQTLTELAASKEYRSLIRNVMEQQWLLKPEELKTEHKVNELYERLDKQLGQIERVLKAFGQNTSQLTDTAANVRSNIQFMNQLNQTYAYVQIPLKLAGQNAHSDLYVYTDKRKGQEQDGELTAFLHLDLEHLGSTDVSVKLHKKKVTTNFYLEDDKSYQLILENMDQLERRLLQKGYDARIHVTNQGEKVNFVEDLLKQGAPSSQGMVHRYSFDVRA